MNELTPERESYLRDLIETTSGFRWADVLLAEIDRLRAELKEARQPYRIFGPMAGCDHRTMYCVDCIPFGAQIRDKEKANG